MEYLDNPAGRLKLWIDRFDALRDKSVVISDALAQILGMEPSLLDGRIAAMKTGAMLADLCHDIRVESTMLPDYVEPEVLLEDFDQVERAFDHFTLARQVRVADWLAQINPAGHRSLDLLSRQLHRFRPQPLLEEAVQQTLVEKVRNLREQVYDATDLDDDLRDFVLRRFGDVEAALADAAITGAGPVEVVTESLIGSIGRQPGMWQRIAESSVSGVVSSVTTALFLSLASPPTSNMLPPGTPDTVVNNYVVVQEHPPLDGVTREVIEGVIDTEEEGRPGLPAPPE